MTHSEPWNCPCVDHQAWRRHCDYCNCCACKNISGAKCDICGTINNPLAIPFFTENDLTLCEDCDSKRQPVVDEDIENIMRIDPDLEWKQRMK